MRTISLNLLFPPHNMHVFLYLHTRRPRTWRGLQSGLLLSMEALVLHRHYSVDVTRHSEVKALVALAARVLSRVVAELHPQRLEGTRRHVVGHQS